MRLFDMSRDVDHVLFTQVEDLQFVTYSNSLDYLVLMVELSQQIW